MHQGYLNLSGLTSLSDTAAESLGKHQSDLSLNGLTSLSDAAAESLGNRESGLWLNGLTSLSDAAAKHLNEYKGPLKVDVDQLEDSSHDILCDRIRREWCNPHWICWNCDAWNDEESERCFKCEERGGMAHYGVVDEYDPGR